MKKKYYLIKLSIEKKNYLIRSDNKVRTLPNGAYL